MNNKHKILILILFIVVFSMQCYCSPAEDYTKAVLNDISKNIRKTNKNNVIFNWEKGDKEKKDQNKKEANLKEFPCLPGATFANIIRCKKLNVKYLGDNYVIKRDVEGHSALAYYDSSDNIPKIAYRGFYVVNKVDDLTKETKKCKYCVDETGYILSGWIEEDDGTRYYMSEKSEIYGEAMVGDVLFSNGKIYSFNEEGVLIGNRQVEKQ